MAKLNSLQFDVDVTDIKPLPDGWDSGLNQTGIVAKSTNLKIQPSKLIVPDDADITVAVGYSSTSSSSSKKATAQKPTTNAGVPGQDGRLV
jgi:hypothetical protein